MAAPNLRKPATITAKTATLALTTSAQALVNNPASSGKLIRIISLYVANVDGTNDATVTVNHYSEDDLGGTARKIANTITVPADATLVLISQATPIYLEEDRSLGALASAASDLEIVCSYEEIS
jgi:hypothetical protein